MPDDPEDIDLNTRLSRANATEIDDVDPDILATFVHTWLLRKRIFDRETLKTMFKRYGYDLKFPHYV